MSGAVILIAQLAAGAVTAQPADVSVTAHVEARSVKIEHEGRATLTLHAEPSAGAEPIEVQRSAPPGKTQYRNLTVDLKAEARIADPSISAQTQTSSSPSGDNHADKP